MNIGYHSYFDSRLIPPEYWEKEPECQDHPHEIEDYFQSVGKAVMIGIMRNTLDEEWEDVSQNLDAWARHYFWEIAEYKEPFSHLPVRFKREDLDTWADRYCLESWTQIDL